MNLNTNQCDGCRAKMPIVNGMHCKPNGFPFMTCTAERYPQVYANTTVAIIELKKQFGVTTNAEAIKKALELSKKATGDPNADLT